MSSFEPVNHNYVKLSVTYYRVWRHIHTASDKLTVCDGSNNYFPLTRFLAYRIAYFMKFKMRYNPKERGIIFEFAFYPLSHGVTLQNINIHTHTADVETAFVVYFDKVRRSRFAFCKLVDKLFRFFGKTHSAGIVVARSARNEPQSYGVKIFYSHESLAESPVTTENYRLCIALRGIEFSHDFRSFPGVTRLVDNVVNASAVKLGKNFFKHFYAFSARTYGIVYNIKSQIFHTFIIHRFCKL